MSFEIIIYLDAWSGTRLRRSGRGHRLCHCVSQIRCMYVFVVTSSLIHTLPKLNPLSFFISSFSKVKYVLENCREDMEFFNTWIEKGIIDRLTVWPHVLLCFFILIRILTLTWFELLTGRRREAIRRDDLHRGSRSSSQNKTEIRVPGTLILRSRLTNI